MSKKESLLQAAARLFARQGFDGTTTLQIAAEAKATEPLIYYHFKGKDEIFTNILRSGFELYVARIAALPSNTPSEFAKIANLIMLHLAIVDEKPDEIFLIVSTCPSRLNDPDGVCASIVKEQRRLLNEYLAACLHKGIRDGEFHDVPVEATANLIIAMLNGLLRQRSLRIERIHDMAEVAVGFCRRSLLQ
jgi:AcrR family transcriptional regulator